MTRPKNSCLMPTSTVKRFERLLIAAGANVVLDKDAGTVEITHDDVVVFRAIQKDRNTWIAMFYESEKIKWGDGE